MTDHTTLKLLVKSILENPAPETRNWSLQGLGMLRLYLSLELRLHIWDSRYAVENVSKIHNHPWDFNSYIVAGSVKQHRYAFDSMSRVLHDEGSIPFNYSTLHCGAGNCERTIPAFVWLKKFTEEVYTEGRCYSQRAEEIHESLPEDGTVTLVTRLFTREDRDHAEVFWPDGTEWVSAEPRPATEREVFEITSGALEKWF